MNEDFLHYLWQFQYFQKKQLLTASGEEMVVLHPGHYNTNAGPDFLGARIKIGAIEWNGSIELHLRSSEWEAHRHQHDLAYENVVLHVVWTQDKSIIRKDGTAIPTLILRDRVDTALLHNYKKLIGSGHSIPCKNSFTTVPEIVRVGALEKALVQRLESKSEVVNQLLKDNQDDWEETAYQVLAKNFGFKINSEPFLRLAKATPYKTIRKHSNQVHQVEALLFGQAGMLVTKSKDEYSSSLFQEYEFLKHKYQLEGMNHAEWKFLRLRPSNFPTLRIAQLAKLLASTSGIFSTLLEVTSYKSLAKLFSVQPTEYWKTHYRFGKSSASAVPAFGETSIHNVMINSVVPLLVAYGKSRDDERYVERAMEILQNIPSESNRITKAWQDIGCPSASSFDSQALIELYNNFCGKRMCLSCNIGSYLVKPTSGK